MTEHGRSELPTWRELALDFEREPQSGFLLVCGFEQQQHIFPQDFSQSLVYSSIIAGNKLHSTSIENWPHCVAQNAGSLDTTPIEERLHAIKDHAKRFYWFVAAVERQKLGHGFRRTSGKWKRNAPPDVFRLDDYREKARDACRMLAALTADRQPQGAATDDVTWKGVRNYLEGCRLNGERFTSRAKFGKRIRCSPATVQKAIENGSVELQGWASKQRGESRLNVFPETAAVVFDNTPQGREPSPADILENDDVDVMLARLLDEAQPDERARINAMSPAEQRQLAETAYRDKDLEEQALRHQKAKQTPRD